MWNSFTSQYTPIQHILCGINKWEEKQLVFEILEIVATVINLVDIANMYQKSIITAFISQTDTPGHWEPLSEQQQYWVTLSKYCIDRHSYYCIIMHHNIVDVNTH
jgi:hypothetical protein